MLKCISHSTWHSYRSCVCVRDRGRWDPARASRTAYSCPATTGAEPALSCPNDPSRPRCPSRCLNLRKVFYFIFQIFQEKVKEQLCIINLISFREAKFKNSFRIFFHLFPQILNSSALLFHRLKKFFSSLFFTKILKPTDSQADVAL